MGRTGKACAMGIIGEWGPGARGNYEGDRDLETELAVGTAIMLEYPAEVHSTRQLEVVRSLL